MSPTLKPGWLRPVVEEAAKYDAVRRNVPAVRAALKAADALAQSRFVVAIGGGGHRLYWCDECLSDSKPNKMSVEHRGKCSVGRYLAARKEIGDDV